MLKNKTTKEHYSGLDELLNLELMTNYNSFIVSKAFEYVKNTNIVLDFGSGIATLPLIFRNLFHIDPICIEVDSVNKKYIKERGFKVFESLSCLTKNVDFIFSSNVLEHIEDDLAVLKQFKEKLNYGGKLFLYLPANNILWSKLDESVGHYRRYEYIELKKKCLKAGFEIEILHYADCLGFIASFITKNIWI